MEISRGNNSRILRIINAKFSGYCFYMNKNMWGDFQIWISVPLKLAIEALRHDGRPNRPFWITLSKFRGVFRTQSNNYDETYNSSKLTISFKKAVCAFIQFFKNNLFCFSNFEKVKVNLIWQIDEKMIINLALQGNLD